MSLYDAFGGHWGFGRIILSAHAKLVLVQTTEQFSPKVLDMALKVSVVHLHRLRGDQTVLQAVKCSIRR